MSVQHILSLSYGKDSLACLGAIKELGWQLDRIVHAEIWATENIPADLPPMIEFKAKADRIIEEKYGIKVEHIKASQCYNDVFYKILGEGGKSKYAGKIYGFPMVRGSWCNSHLKMSVLEKFERADIVQYIGIAADEPNRFHNLNDQKRSPLVEAGWNEAECRCWCEENDLLSPIYTTSTRGGCWFCHNQGVQQLRLLRKNYPEYWALMLKWDLDSPVTFKPGSRNSPGHTVHDFEKRFQLEDDGYINPLDKNFRWSVIDDNFLCRQISLFDDCTTSREEFHEEKNKPSETQRAAEIEEIPRSVLQG